MYRKGDLVWVPDKEYVYLLAEVVKDFKPGEAGVVRSVDFDREITLNHSATKNLTKTASDVCDDHTDLSTLRLLNEQSILYSLRKRFLSNEIYTNIGPILISVNPFKELPFYTADVLESCIKGNFQAPHIYNLASKCYDQLISNSKNQSCIVTGESGAGKTEATKLVLQCLAEKCGGDIYTEHSNSTTLEQQILEVNPLLEAFGNARTLRNDNSSRFGKLTQLYISSKKGSINGVGIIDYLLEKSRIVQQAKGERNFHIFYQLFSDAQLCQEFRLGLPENYFYLTQNGDPASVVCSTINDAQDWKATLDAMHVLNMKTVDIKNIQKTLVGIMNLGNISFSSSTPQADAQMHSGKWLDECCKFLGFDSKKLQTALLTTELKIRNESTFKPHTKQQAIDARDALAKFTYGALFSYLVATINERLRAMKKQQRVINILDIFGFESFLMNSFEQLCINYCNEKLQVHFINYVFKAEEQAYKEEGLNVDKITFIDTSDILDVFENRTTGIYALLDEQNKLRTGSNEKFLGTILQFARKNKYLKTPKGSQVRKHQFMRNNFNVVHFAGEVSYNVTNFLEKNSDKLLKSVEDIIGACSFTFLKNVYKSYRKSTNTSLSLGQKFKSQLNELMYVLNISEPHFIRTIKPNPEKVCNRVNSQLVLEQLQCAGLVGVCEVYKNGYPIKYAHNEFYNRYRILLQSKVNGLEALFGALSSRGIVNEGELQMGKSRVFMKISCHEEIEALRNIELARYVIKIQSFVRGFLSRKATRDIFVAVKKLKLALKRQDVNLLKEAIADTVNIKSNAATARLVAEAKAEIKRIEQIASILSQLKQAMAAEDIPSLEIMLSTLGNLGANMSDQHVVQAQTQLEKLIGARANRPFQMSEEGVTLFLDQLWIKIKSPSGIDKSDVENLTELKAQLQTSSLNASLREQTKALFEFAQLQLEVQEFVDIALNTRDQEDMRSALNLVQQIDLQTTKSTQLVNIMIESNRERQGKSTAIRGNTVNFTSVMGSIKLAKGEISVREKLESSSKNLNNKIKPPITRGRKGPGRFSAVSNLADFKPLASRRKNNPRGSMLSISIQNIVGKGNMPQNKYDMDKFYLLRPAEERSALCWSGRPLKRSLMRLQNNLNTVAIQVNKLILQFTGDDKFQYPSSAGQKVLQYGIDYPILSNELYAQVLRNINLNKKPYSEDRSWILLILVSQLIPPTTELFPYIASFLENFSTKPLLVGNSAKLCLAQLKRTIKLGYSDTVPDVEQIAQYFSRPALLLEMQTTKIDSSNKLSTVTIPCYPDTDVDTIVDCACEIVGHNPNKYIKFGLFVKGAEIVIESDLKRRLNRFYKKWDPSKLKHVNYFASLYANKEAELFKQLINKYGAEPAANEMLPKIGEMFDDGEEEELFYPIPWWMYPGDVFMKMSFKGRECLFSIKQKIILQNETPNMSLIQQQRLLIAAGELAIPDYQKLLNVAGILYVLSGSQIQSRKDILQIGLDYTLPQIWINEEPADTLAQHIFEVSQHYKNQTKKDLMSTVFNLCRSCEGFGVWFYPVTQVTSFSKEQGETTSQLDYVGISHRGLHLFNSVRTESVQLFPYSGITEYGANNDVVWFNFKGTKGSSGPKAEFSTTFSWEIYAIIQGYIDFGNPAKAKPAPTFTRYSVFLPGK